MIQASLRIVVCPDRRDDLVRTMRSMLGPTAVAAGCLGCRLYQDHHDVNSFEWVEEWDSRESLDRHIRSNRYRRILEALELAETPPQVRFDTVSKSAGMELIAEVRAAQQAPHGF